MVRWYARFLNQDLAETQGVVYSNVRHCFFGRPVALRKGLSASVLPDTCAQTRMRMHTHARTHMRACTRTHIRIHTRARTPGTHAHARANAHAHARSGEAATVHCPAELYTDFTELKVASLVAVFQSYCKGELTIRRCALCLFSF